MDIDREVEARLGQAMVAFGQGTGTIRVTREAIESLRRRYEARLRRVLERDPGRVEREIGGLLDVVRTMGRLSAQVATSRGEVTIERNVFERAARLAEEVVQRHTAPVDRPTPYCGNADEGRTLSRSRSRRPR